MGHEQKSSKTFDSFLKYGMIIADVESDNSTNACKIAFSYSFHTIFRGSPFEKREVVASLFAFELSLPVKKESHAYSKSTFSSICKLIKLNEAMVLPFFLLPLASRGASQSIS